MYVNVFVVYWFFINKKHLGQFRLWFRDGFRSEVSRKKSLLHAPRRLFVFLLWTAAPPGGSAGTDTGLAEQGVAF